MAGEESGILAREKILNEEDALEAAAKQGNSPKRWEILADHWGKRLWRLVLGEREEAMRMASWGSVFMEALQLTVVVGCWLFAGTKSGMGEARKKDCGI